MQEDRYVQTIRELLHKKRFDHSLNVAQRAVELAKRYGEDEQKAYIAGILHDICKNMQPEEQLQWMKKSAINFGRKPAGAAAGVARLCRRGVYPPAVGDRG